MVDFLLVGCFFFLCFSVSMILACVVRIEKRLKSIFEDLRIISLLKK